jgi:uncharacterized Fe-S cluster-containing radical SAM superfamily protein
MTEVPPMPQDAATVFPAPSHAPLDPAKFRDPRWTARGEPRARVALEGLRTLWVNTGTLCNLACAGCYMESSPRNDRLAYFPAAALRGYLAEIRRARMPTTLIGFTGGEPFMNPEIMTMLADALSDGLAVLVLTNAMAPLRRHRPALGALLARYPGRITVRVSLDHYTPAVHEAERGAGSFAASLDGLAWLSRAGFAVHVACRMLTDEPEAALRTGFARLFAAHSVPIDARDPVALMLFPEMDASRDVPEITTACWDILGRAPEGVMCASSRMVLWRRGATAPSVVACTLLPHAPGFALGESLAEAARPVALNHPHCARFCVLGGAACSREETHPRRDVRG